MRKTQLLTAALIVTFGTPAMALEGPPVETPVIVPPTVPVIEPPPIPPPPPPQMVINYNLPTILPNSLIPTDTLGVRGFRPNYPNTPADLMAAATKKDDRYQFTGQWIPFFENGQNHDEHLSTSPLSPVAFVEPVAQTAPKAGKAEFFIRPKISHPSEAVYMPTREAPVHKITSDNLQLGDGAVLVRAGKTPVYVTTRVNGEKVATRISRGALAMISAFDNQTVVLNLTDNRLGAVVCTLPGNGGNTSVSVLTGQVAEVYPIEATPGTNLVSKRVRVNQRTRDDIGLLVSDCHYVRAMKKFQLTPLLDRTDYNRVLKTAVAVAIVRR